MCRMRFSDGLGGGHEMIWYRRLSFKTRVFLGCLLRLWCKIKFMVL